MLKPLLNHGILGVPSYDADDIPGLNSATALRYAYSVVSTR